MLIPAANKRPLVRVSFSEGGVPDESRGNPKLGRRDP
jgi:hypothetical protein